jgi:integrase
MSSSKRFYQYSPPIRAQSGKLWAYRRVYKGRLLRKQGFSTKAKAEGHLLQAMQDMDALERGELRIKPTTMQDALDLFKRKQDVRAVEKSYAYGVHARATINRLQEFVGWFGKNRLVREVTAEDIKEWMHYHTKRTSQSTACTYVGRLMGMLKYARRTKADLHNWMPPEVKYEKKIKHSGRIVDDDEYQTLVTALLNPKRPDVQKCSHWSMRLRAELWREAADAVRLLRNTGGRLNEVLRLKWTQINLAKKTVALYASKTERERVVPLSTAMVDLLKERKREGLASDEHVFARATTNEFDRQIARACRQAGAQAKIAYGRFGGDGFTLHSLRHTYITHLLSNGVDAPTVMQLSGHKSYQSFSVYLHKTDLGEKRACLILEKVDHFLTTSGALKTDRADEGQNAAIRQTLTNQRNAYPARLIVL